MPPSPKYRARYYDPDDGRFLQTDPIGYEDQMNLYAYLGNNPLNATDPSGMICDGCTGYADLRRDGFTHEQAMIYKEQFSMTPQQAMVLAGIGIIAFDIFTFPSGEGSAGFALIGASIRHASTATKVTTSVGATAGFMVEGINQYEAGEFHGIKLGGATLTGGLAGYGSTRGTTVGGQMMGAFRGGFYGGLGTSVASNAAVGEFNLSTSFSSGFRSGTFSAAGAGAGGLSSNFLQGTSRFGARGTLNAFGVGAGAGSGEVVGAGASEVSDYLMDLWREANEIK